MTLPFRLEGNAGMKYLLTCSVGPLALFIGLFPLVAQCLASAEVDYNREVRPILSNRCFKCHGPDASERKGGRDGLRLDTREGATADLGGYAAVVPGNVNQSVLWQRITAADPEMRMPPGPQSAPLTAAEIQVIRRWILAGAPYAQHWSYIPPQRPALPSVIPPEWIQNEIDLFVLEKLQALGLEPQPEADRPTLIRRVSLHLTGLPPRWEDVEQFIRDPSPAAYENVVDRLLRSPAYGEHWAHLWLDLARYADSAGYADDPPRTIWAYRDYVIRAFNQNLPFDQFTIEQLAGDLLPHPSEDQLIATAFHRNTQTNNEGGTDDEEFRNVAVVDRVNTTFAVWMGTTIQCAQCHNHKYDPISQEEYYRVFAIFNQTEDADRRDEAPVLELWQEETKRQRQLLQQQLAAVNAQDGDPPSAAIAVERAQLERAWQRLKPYTTVPVMRELPAGRQRPTRIQIRGNFQDLGAEVSPGVPQVFHPLEETPINRLALARWLVDRRNPLTARVIMNRLWEHLFGQGLVITSEEFGSQGEPPTHPALLDWLAVEFMDSGWDLKHMLKLMVMSATYRQSSRVTPAAEDRDPDNRWFSRGPRFRLPAETIRDQALFVGGLLSHRMFGPPVRPPQPKLGLNAAFGSQIDWQTSEGEDRYRRALYTLWRRSNPYPSMTTFDAPNREVCTVRRQRTNTPLQALVLLNDPVYLEAAQGLARRVLQIPGSDVERVHWAVRWALARSAQDAEVQALTRLFAQARAHLAAHPQQALKLAMQPRGPLPAEIDPVQAAAWTVVASTLLNLDETLMPR
ncbi:MAG: chromosome segregation protein [Planctomycetaceae bacterium]|nr:MAG: chromosome segregation protein [Planctomycetaceae bacterium]